MNFLALKPAASWRTDQNAHSSIVAKSGRDSGNAKGFGGLALDASGFSESPLAKNHGVNVIAVGVLSSMGVDRSAWTDAFFAFRLAAIASHCSSVRGTRDNQAAFRIISFVKGGASDSFLGSGSCEGVLRETARAFAWLVAASAPLAMMHWRIQSRRRKKGAVVVADSSWWWSMMNEGSGLGRRDEVPKNYDLLTAPLVMHSLDWWPLEASLHAPSPRFRHRWRLRHHRV